MVPSAVYGQGQAAVGGWRHCFFFFFFFESLLNVWLGQGLVCGMACGQLHGLFEMGSQLFCDWGCDLIYGQLEVRLWLRSGVGRG